jgi:transcriptional regulator with PAS, ATPase and Fis domain
VQVKLLRVLEEREIVRVGGQATLPVDVRVVSASNRDLEELVDAGEFRRDLLYRLQVITLRLPPLRERRADIRPLAERFIAAACEEHGRTVTTVAPDCYAALEAFDWPGNVRQLRNVIEAAVVMATRPVLQASDLRLQSAVREAAARPAGGFSPPDHMTLAEMEKHILLEMLRRNHGNRSLVAEKLDISRRTIQRKVKEYQLPF